MIAKEYRGKVFLQIAPRLRWRVPGDEIESFRPMSDLTGAVVGDPPAITFDDHADADIERWLAQGRIRLSEDQTVKAHAPLSDAEAHAKPPKPPAEPPSETGGA